MPSDGLVAPTCPCGTERVARLRFDADDGLGVLICPDCGEVLLAVELLATCNALQMVPDPAIEQVPEGIYYELEREGRLPGDG